MRQRPVKKDVLTLLVTSSKRTVQDSAFNRNSGSSDDRENAHKTRFLRCGASHELGASFENMENFAFHSPRRVVVAVVCFSLAITVLLDLGGRQWDIVGH